MAPTTSTIRPLAPGAAALWFGAFGLAMLATTRLVLPPLVRAGWHPHLAWFAAGMPVFFAMLVAVATQLRRERSSWSLLAVADRLRLRRLRRGDLVAIAVALAVTGIATPALLALGFAPAPSFMHSGPLAPHERTLLLWWLPFFLANILGEELLWRGLLLPRQERVHGRHAWVVHGLGWVAFHVAFGPSMMLVTAPLILAQSWACQRTGNTTVGIVIHGGVNGMGFVALAFVPI